ncbi:preprotein translocase subunit SecE [Tissierella praeacuta DSM 18095]|uniref:Protein translocase subunit SecE n=1 Tax=Tissierella praeacuta DSM 18095 TaxID=1123404 RepID=A0A1M4ZSH7_9FIRM|nr:preprotein translocase subunit SecE [Tissierella praeacuta]TCU69724.1 protein translocase subunit secE/sec61 gamma [Tissierella praeacuta]SHF21023.1 preprotein translocase subunit SecE [Tissierella praeacuta DSM 18095]SUP03330.1 Preprotein translocase subunit secE [Tissierella praeacuta]
MTAPTGTNGTKKAKMSTYFRGVKAEMKKVIWPGKKELINYTGVVIMISAIIAIVVWVLDLLIHGVLRFII